MLPHIGLFFLKSVGKTIFETAVEYYARDIVISNKKVLASHIDSICSHNEPRINNSYAARVGGYYTLDEAIKKIDTANTTMAKDIKELMFDLYNKDDCVIIHVNNNDYVHTVNINEVNDIDKINYKSTYCVIS